jgi:hypothetical protein
MLHVGHVYNKYLYPMKATRTPPANRPRIFFSFSTFMKNYQASPSRFPRWT